MFLYLKAVFPIFHLFLQFQKQIKMAMFFVFLLNLSRSNHKSDYSPDLTNNNLVTPLYDFDNPSYHAEEEGAEDCDQLELARLLKQEEKVIQPHEKRVKFVIPGTAEVRRESES
jgi:hypothetical protein